MSCLMISNKNSELVLLILFSTSYITMNDEKKIVTCQSIRYVGYGIGDPDFDSRQHQDILLFFKSPDPLWSPLSLLYYGYRGSFLGVKRPERHVGHSPTSDAVAKSEWSYTSILFVCFNDRQGQLHLLYLYALSMYFMINKATAHALRQP